MNINYKKSLIQFFLLISSVIGSIENDSKNITNTTSSIPTVKKPTEWADYLYDKKNDRYFSEEEVNKIADEKDFINLGKVGELEGYWLFKMKEGEPAEENEDNSNSSNINVKKNKIHKRTVTEAEDDLSYLEDLHWFEKQKYVQRYKREFVAYNINDFLNNGIGKSNVYDDNIQRRQFINSYKYDHQMNGEFVNRRSLYDILRKRNFNDEKKEPRGITFHDDYSDTSFDFESLNFTDPFFFRQWHLVINRNIIYNEIYIYIFLI